MGYSDRIAVHCNLQGHSPLTPIYLYIHEMNFDELRGRNYIPRYSEHGQFSLREFFEFF